MKHTGYHKDCSDCKTYNLAEVDRIIFEIKMSMKKPNWKPQTSEGIRKRADYLREMATGIRLNGGQVKDEYL